MNKRGLISLSVVAIALIAYILVFERDSVTSKEREGRAGRVLVSFVRDKVERLTVQRKGAEVVLARSKNADGVALGFEVVAPYHAKADSDVVDHLLGELEWLSARRTLDEISAADRKAFGLDAPRVRVTFAAAGESHLLSVGNGDVHGDALYVQVDREARAYVVPKTLLEVLDHEPNAYRDKQLFPELTVAWAYRLSVTEHGELRQLVQSDKRWWIEAQPSSLHPGVKPRNSSFADAKRIDELLHALAELRAAHYLDADAKVTAQLAKPALKLEVEVVPDETREDKQAKLFVLEVAGPCVGHAGERYVRSSVGAGPALLACVRDELLVPLMLGPELREPRLFASAPSDVSGFLLTEAGAVQSLAREGEGWKVRSAIAEQAAVPVDAAAVEGWLHDLATARALAYEPLGDFKERGSLLLERADKRSERIAFGELDSQGEVTVRRGDELLLVHFPGSVFDRLQPSPVRFSALEPWAKHQPSEVVRVTAHSGELTRTLTLDHDVWTAPAGATVNPDRVRELVRDLIDLQAKAYVTPSARPAHGFERSSPHVSLALREGAPLELTLGAATERGGYARFDQQGVYEVESGVAALLRELAGGTPAPQPAREPGPEAPPEEEEDEEDSDEPAHDHAH